MTAGDFLGGSMSRLSKFLFLFLVFFAWNVPAFAFPDFLDMFRKDPMRRASVDGCNTCHMSPQGGDERNDFGRAFENNSMIITPVLRAQFPSHFVFPVAKVSDTLIIHFSDPDNKVVVVESGGKRTTVDVEKKTVDGKAAETPSGGPIAAAPAAAPSSAAAAAPIAEIRERNELNAGLDAYAHEGAFLGSNVVNIPNGKPTRKGGVDFWIGHRFAQPICLKNCRVRGGAGPGDLFGFDSSATVGYGVRVGLTDRVAVSVFRANAFKAMEFTGAYQVSRQGEAAPVTLQARGGFEARRNPAGDRDDYWHQYSPFIQVVATRTFFDRVSVVLAPTFAFNTRNENTFFPADFRFGAEHNHTTAMGIGTGIRLLPTVSLVGEYIPRFHGFKGELKNRPGVSIGLQKSTYRHTFELLIARQEPMTTTQYAFQGTDAFRVGFNIFRRIR